MWSRFWKVTPYVLYGLLGGSIGHWFLDGRGAEGYPELVLLYYFVFCLPDLSYWRLLLADAEPF